MLTNKAASTGFITANFYIRINTLPAVEVHISRNMQTKYVRYIYPLFSLEQVPSSEALTFLL